RWEQWLSKLLPSSYPPDLGFHPPLQDGDPDAVPVLVELLRAPEVNVRILAVWGLKEVGSRARETIPALLAALNDEDEEVAHQAWWALHSIDKSVAPEYRWDYLGPSGTGYGTFP